MANEYVQTLWSLPDSSMCIFFQTEEVCGKGFGITVVGMNKTTVKVMVRECYELPPSPPVAAAIATTSVRRRPQLWRVIIYGARSFKVVKYIFAAATAGLS